MSREKITEAVKNGKVLISDGAWGTFLYNKGLGAGECPELWNVDRRGDVLDIAKSYIVSTVQDKFEQEGLQVNNVIIESSEFPFYSVRVFYLEDEEEKELQLSLNQT